MQVHVSQIYMHVPTGFAYVLWWHISPDAQGCLSPVRTQLVEDKSVACAIHTLSCLCHSHTHTPTHIQATHKMDMISSAALIPVWSCSTKLWTLNLAVFNINHNKMTGMKGINILYWNRIDEAANYALFAQFHADIFQKTDFFPATIPKQKSLLLDVRTWKITQTSH